MSYKTEPIGPFENGHTTTVISYKVNGVQYHEKISIDLQNANFGTSLGISRSSSIIVPDVANGGNRVIHTWTEVDPNSTEGQTILNDPSGARGNSYLSEFNDSGGIFDQASKENQTVNVHNALRESGMYETAYGTKSFNQASWPGPGEVADISDEDSPTVTESAVRPRDSAMEMAGMSMQYPSDAIYTDGGQDHLYIEAFKYQAPQAGSLAFTPATSENKNDPWRGTYKGARSALEGLDRGSNIKRGIFYPDINKGGVEQTQGNCRLPIPNKLGVSNGVGWGEGRANSVEAGAFFQAMGTAQNFISGEDQFDVGNALKSIAGGSASILNRLGADLQNQGDSATVLSAVLAKVALQQLNIDVDPAQFITRSSGKSINPNLELLFSGPKLRNFTFAFQFAPNDAADAKVVRDIIRWFKMGMAPTLETKSAIFLGSPKVFRLKYMNGNTRIRGLNIFKICALTACELDMSPEGFYQSYEDTSAISMPARINMALSFTELTPILENDYHGGADHDNESYNDIGLSGANAIGANDIGY